MRSQQKIIPAEQAQTEIFISNSRFIATAAPAFSVEEAKAFISQIKAQLSDASHNVPVFLIGHGSSIIAHSSDDGEPSGTAGKPALSVLKGSGFGDIAVVITRYFGGTKLGKGGLVRAYSDSMRSVLDILPKAQKIATQTTSITIPYNLFEQTKLLAKTHQGLIQAEDFAVQVTLKIQFIQEDLEPFQQAVQELSNGKIQAWIIETNPNTIMPL